MTLTNAKLANDSIATLFLVIALHDLKLLHIIRKTLRERRDHILTDSAFG